MPKRDFDRMRQLLLWAEECEDANYHGHDAGIINLERVALEEGKSLTYEDNYQLWLMEECGWLNSPTGEPRKFRITSEGHDYLECVRDAGIWARTKDTVTEAGGNVTLEIIRSLAVGFLKKKIKDQTGIDI